MITAVGAIIAGAVTSRLWPMGALFLLLFPALLVAMSLPTLPQTMTTLGRPTEVTTTFVLLYYLQNLVIISVFFFVAFGIQKWLTRGRGSESGSRDA